MEYLIYKISEGRKQYLTNIPRSDDLLGGIGYQSLNSGGIPSAAGTAPTEQDAQKVCDYLREACGGEPEDHFYEVDPRN